jgi:hypothetical protein
VSAAIWTCVLCLAVALVLLLLGYRSRGQDEGETEVESLFGNEIPVPLKPKTPSLVFVFGAPLGDNDSPTWIMMLKHYGPSSAHNCIVVFYDKDRKNIEHLWLANHPGTPFLPPGQFDESQKSLTVAETGPEGGPAGSFNWAPLDRDRQHYSVSISCRDGTFVEEWEVTRVNGVLRTKIVIEHGPEWVRKNPDADPVVFKCEDREFTGTPLLTAVPKVTARSVHPGWKANHGFDIPVAIIDPNGNVQTMSGVKQPDGTTRTDFGCWDLLNRHFGDASSTQQ